MAQNPGTFTPKLFVSITKPSLHVNSPVHCLEGGARQDKGVREAGGQHNEDGPAAARNKTAAAHPLSQQRVC